MNSYTAKLCIKCNEFFGSDDRQGMCSVCFKKVKPSEEPKLPDPIIETKPIENPIIEEPKVAEVKEVILPEPEKIVENTKPVQNNKMNCWICNVKVGYLGFKCHCEYVFCGKHRHFSEHKCDFDYKSYDRSKLKANLDNKKVI
jgi:hypothetical protein